ncbi:MAG: hypothetical protein Q9169_004967 [Polycauliona sp. 2 TL-2023]
MTTSHSTSLLLSVAKLWLLLVLASTSAAAAVSQPPAPRDPPCTGSFHWLGKGLKPEDCKYAIEKFWRIDVARYRSHEFEFVGLGGQRYTKLSPMKTPRRYQHDTCTLVIANLNLFPRMDLPEPPRRPFKYSDVSSFEELYQAAGRVDQHCVSWVHQAGYQDTGELGSLGVFLMATGSYEEEYIPEGVTPKGRLLAMANQQNQSAPILPADTA